MMTVTVKNGLLKAQRQWVNGLEPDHALQLLILNLMPTKVTTERQFIQRFAALDTDVAVTFMYPETHQFKSVPRELVAENYVTLGQVVDRYFDGLIITGAPVEKLAFEDVDYWSELEGIISWAQRHASQTLFECWAAQAGLYEQFNVQKRLVDHKVFGIYSADHVDEHSQLVSGFAAGGQLKMPQSRHTELVLPTSLPDGLRVVADSDQVGPLVLAAPALRAVYVTGHPEYEAETLANEYERDLRKRLPIQAPQHYFKAGQPREVDYSWSTASCRLYANWLKTLNLTKVGL
ncbi:homoserine O-succinyltransferase [Lactiplantibacillus plajomi]